MNARQKAKKLKKELEDMKKLPLVKTYKVTNLPIEHLKSSVNYSLHFRNKAHIPSDDEIRLQLATNLAKEIKDKIIIKEEEVFEGIWFPVMKYSTDIFISFGENSNE